MIDIERERERQRHGRREKLAPCWEPDVGLDPGMPGSWPGPTAVAKPLSHPGIPIIWFLIPISPQRWSMIHYVIICFSPQHFYLPESIHLLMTETRQPYLFLHLTHDRSNLKYTLHPSYYFLLYSQHPGHICMSHCHLSLELISLHSGWPSNL